MKTALSPFPSAVVDSSNVATATHVPAATSNNHDLEDAAVGTNWCDSSKTLKMEFAM